MAHILVVDDEKNYRIVLSRILEEAGHRVSLAENPFAALELLSHEGVALILSDLRMPHMDGWHSTSGSVKNSVMCRLSS